MFRKLILSLLLFMLYACNDGGSNSTGSGGSKASTELPSGLQKLILGNGGTLSAYITIDGATNNRTKMNIDRTGKGSASANIPGLSLATHNISISYEYTTGSTTYVLASANRTVDLASGSASINFTSINYDFDFYDNDRDGFSNAYELGEGTNPGDSLDVPADRLTIVPKVRSVTVNWNTRNKGDNVYNLYYSSVKGFDPDNPGTNGAVINGIKPPQTITGLVNGQTYYFVLETNYNNNNTVRSVEIASRPGELVFNNGVNSIALAADGIRYMGGQFTSVGTTTGGGAPLDSVIGKLAAGDFPQVDDRVLAAASDGQGGWYIGGRFKRVGGVSRSNLAHILADFTLDKNWNPKTNNTVNALVVKDNIVYAGGSFTTINGTPFRRLAAIGVDGVPLNWNLDANNSVTALAVGDNTVYVGGAFSTIGGNTFNGLAAINIDEVTGIGAVDTGWNPGVDDGGINTLVVVGNTVYAGGDFTTIGGVTRNRLAAIVAGGDNRGSLTEWDPDVEGGSVFVMKVSGNTVYVGGNFTTIGGVARNRLAAIKTTDGLVRSRWNLNPDDDVTALAIIGNVVYVGGDFTIIAGKARTRLAAVGKDGFVTRWNPKANNDVNVLAASGNALYAGGIFTAIGNSVVDRNRLAAIGVDDNLTSWRPSVDGTTKDEAIVEVIPLVLSVNTIYAGGNFDSVNGIAVSNLVAIGTDGKVNVNWTPDADKVVRALAADNNGVLYTGGDFSKIGSVNRSRLAAINQDGTLTGWRPGANSDVYTLAVSGTKVYVGGSFTEINGVPRGLLASVDAVGTGTDGTLDSWNPNLGSTRTLATKVRALAISGNTVYVGGVFTSVGGNNAFGNLASININGNINAGWSPQVNKEVISMAVSNNTVYVGGRFTEINGDSKITRMAAIATDNTGTVNTGWVLASSGDVNTLSVDAGNNTVYVGGRFRAINESIRSGYAAVGTDGVLQ